MFIAAFASALSLAAVTAYDSGMLQDPGRPVQDPAVQLPEVVVEGRLPEEQARDFVEEVADPARGVSVARWRHPLCISVVHLRPETAQYLIERVAQVATDVGLEVGKPGCQPDVIVLATSDGPRLARLIADRHRIDLTAGVGMSGTRRDFQAFVAADRPVRWWHLATSVNPDTGRNTLRRPRYDNFNNNDKYEVFEHSSARVTGSLLTSTTRQELRRTIVIVDFDRVGDVDFDQLADYIAFVSLAQVNPQADTSGFSTVLNVFDDPLTTPGLTDWDRAYLHGLYNSDDAVRTASARDGAIRRSMVRVLAGREPEEE